MKRNHIMVLFVAITMSLLSCSNIMESLSISKKHFFIYEYSHPTPNVYQLTDAPTKKSSNITVGKGNVNDLGKGVVQISIDGVRVQSRKNNYEVKSLLISELDNGKWELQDEFNNTSSESKTDVALVLVLDMSTSLGQLVDDIKLYAKNFVKTVTNSTKLSTVSVIFFSGRNNILQTKFFNSKNVSELYNIIDKYADFRDRTALFHATLEGTKSLDSLKFNGTKTLVVFTDGGDNDTNNPDQAKSHIYNNSHERICIGFEGKDFDKIDLKSIASNTSNYVTAKKRKALQKKFNEVAKKVTSVYRYNYNRSDQLLSNSVSVKYELKTKKIK